MNTVKREGMRSLYAGVNAQFPCIFIPSFIYYVLYDISNRWSRKLVDYMETPGLIPWIPSVTATFSEGVSLVVYVPMDGIKTRLQSGNYKYQSIVAGLRETAQREGLMRFFSASPKYLMKALVYHTCLFQSYEYLRIKWRKQKEDDMRIEAERRGEVYHQGDLKFNMNDTICATLIANTLATAITNPVDMLIIRYQITDSSKSQLSTLNLLKQCFVNEGMKGFNRGLLLRLCYTNVQCLIYLPLYEYLRQNYGEDFAA